jgi:hypothetical protein
MIANDDRFDITEFQNNQSLFETSIMHSSSLGWNFPLCRVPLSGVEALPKSALMSAFISVSTRSAFAAAFCNADHKDKKLFTSKTYPRLHDKKPRGYTSCIQSREKVKKHSKI